MNKPKYKIGDIVVMTMYGLMIKNREGIEQKLYAGKHWVDFEYENYRVPIKMGNVEINEYTEFQCQLVITGATASEFGWEYSRKEMPHIFSKEIEMNDHIQEKDILYKLT